VSRAYEEFYGSEKHRTCARCGHVTPRPPAKAWKPRAMADEALSGSCSPTNGGQQDQTGADSRHRCRCWNLRYGKIWARRRSVAHVAYALSDDQVTFWSSHVREPAADRGLRDGRSTPRNLLGQVVPRRRRPDGLFSELGRSLPTVCRLHQQDLEGHHRLPISPWNSRKHPRAEGNRQANHVTGTLSAPAPISV